jgi:hypothetical protein
VFTTFDRSLTPLIRVMDGRVPATGRATPKLDHALRPQRRNR